MLGMNSTAPLRDQLAIIKEELNAEYCAVQMTSSGDVRLAAVGLDRKQLASYRERYSRQSPHSRLVAKLKPGEVFSDVDDPDRARYEQSRAFREFFVPNRAEHCLIAQMSIWARGRSSLVVRRSSRSGPFVATESLLLQRYAIMLGDAIHLWPLDSFKPDQAHTRHQRPQLREMRASEVGGVTLDFADAFAEEKLTNAESHVLALFLAGHPPKTIARARHVSLETIRTQIKQIRLKLDARSGNDLMRIGMRMFFSYPRSSDLG